VEKTLCGFGYNALPFHTLRAKVAELGALFESYISLFIQNKSMFFYTFLNVL